MSYRIAEVLMQGTDETARRLLGSSAQLSRDPETEIDWDAPVGDGYGLSPEWSTRYSTPYCIGVPGCYDLRHFG